MPGINAISLRIAKRVHDMELSQAQIDQSMMKIALNLAEQASIRGEVPVGAIVVGPDRHTILAKSFNLRENLQSPLAHAELIALHRAAKKLGSWRLVDCTLYVTLEPCPMCAGAMINSRIKRLVYGARDPKAGSTDSLLQLGHDTRFNHRFEVVNNVLGEECSHILTSFFRKLRNQ